MTPKPDLHRLTTQWHQVLDSLPEYPKGVTAGAFALTTSRYRQGSRNRYYDAQEGRLYHELTPETVIYPCLEEKTTDGKDITWMTATQDECASMSSHTEQAYGQVLLSGLGLGIAAWLSACNPNTKSVTVVEKQVEVIELIEPVVRHPKITIVHDDIYRHLESTKFRYDFISIDIWPGIGRAVLEYTHIREICQNAMKSNGVVRTWMDEIALRLENEQTVNRAIAEMNATYGRKFAHPEVAKTRHCELCGTLFHIDCYGFCLECCFGLGIIDAARGGVKRRVRRFMEKARAGEFNRLSNEPPNEP